MDILDAVFYPGKKYRRKDKMVVDSLRLSQQLQDLFKNEEAELAGRFSSMTRLMEALGKFWHGLSIPSDWGLTEVERGEKRWHFQVQSRQAGQVGGRMHHLEVERSQKEFPLRERLRELPTITYAMSVRP